jgi:molybdopterin-guanine dinucleotide biosynthesis adapter protein
MSPRAPVLFHDARSERIYPDHDHTQGEAMNAIGFAGYSGSGKTSLIERVIPALRQRGLKVSVLKHAHHSFDIDQPGKDSFRHREAGASEVMLVSEKRWVIMHEAQGRPEPSMEEMLTRFEDCDVVLVEGYKFGALPKIEVYRSQFSIDKKTEPMFKNDQKIVAVATDASDFLRAQTQLPLLDLNRPEDVAAFIVQYFGGSQAATLLA